MIHSRMICSVLVVIGILAAPAIADGDAEGQLYRDLLEKRSEAIVTVKAVLKTEISMMGQLQDDESRVEIPGVVVDPNGIVLVSNMPFSSTRMRQMMGGVMPMGIDINITPIDMKVLFAGDEEEYDAFIAATDAEFDLAFIQIEGIEGREISTIDFDESGRTGIGDRIFTLSRMNKGYDYAAHVQAARISGEIRRPRRAWIIDRHMDALGLPVFSIDGEVVGVLTTIASGTVDDPDDAGQMRAMMRMLTGGGVGTDAFASFVLPARNVRSLLVSARDRAAEMLAERAKAVEAGDSDD
jgi:hypothetical protein